MASILRSIRDGTTRGVAQHFVVTYLIPLGAPVVTAVFGHIQGLPLMYIFLGVLGSFALASHGLLRFDEWRFRRAVEHKLAFLQPRFSTVINEAAFSLGLTFQNKADFPIEIEIANIRTRINDRVPTQSVEGTKRVVIPAQGFGWWDDHGIFIDAPASGVLIGLIEATVKYGRAGSELAHEISGRKKVIARFDENGVSTGFIWNDEVDD